MNTNVTDVQCIDEAIAEFQRINIESAQCYMHLMELKAHGVKLVDSTTLEPVIPDNVVLLNERRH